MDRTPDIHRTIVEWIDAGRSFAVALVLAAEGSAPRKEGARAVIDASGAITGTIGGGLVEAEAQRRGVAACQSGRPAVLAVSLRGIEATDAEPLCGGRVRILIDPTAAKDRAAYAAAFDAITRREQGVLVTRVRSGDEVTTSVAWFPAEDIPADRGFPGEEALRSCLAHEKPRLFEARKPEETIDVLVEPLIPEPRLLIVGGGHIGQALAAQASLLGFAITVVDDRPEFADAARYPAGVEARCGDCAEEVAAFPIGADTSVVIVTRGHEHDAAALAACIHRPAAYIGMIGSKRKVALLRDEFLASGRATAREFDRVFAPIGLDIGAVTVPEIATSIAAQLVVARRKGRAAACIGSMKLP